LSELRRFALEDGSDLTTLIAGLEQRAPFQREPDRTIERTVYDTFDWRLHDERTVLEHERVSSGPRPRKGDAPAVPWLVWRSIDTGEVLGRLAVDEVPRFVWDLPDTPTVERLAPILEMRALLPLVTVRIEQTSLRLVDDEGKTEARVVIDRAWVSDRDEPLVPVIEVVPVRGYPRAADRVTELLALQVVLRPVEHDVVEEALALAGLSPGDYSSKLKVRLDPQGHALDAVVTVLGALFATMLANEPGTRDDLDSEFLHDYRVAVRRTRSVLGMAKGVVPPRLLDRLRADFKWLGDITTPTRDCDVYLLTYPEFEASLPEALRPDLRPLRGFLVEQQRQSHGQLVAELGSPRYADLLRRYRRWLSAPRREPGSLDARVVPDAEQPAVEFAAARTWKAYRGLVKDGRRITNESPAVSLHELRKDAKKLRYALECFGSLFPADHISPLVKELKGVQDVLGEFQDCEVQKGSLRGFGEAMLADGGTGSAPALMAMGYLIEQIDERERVARDQFADRFASFDAHHNRHRFRHLFAPPSIDEPPTDEPPTDEPETRTR
jgi:CHAD domain-containing protein